MILNFILSIVLIASCQACSAQPKDQAKTIKHEATKAAAKSKAFQVPNSLVKNQPPKVREDHSYKTGEDLKKQISSITVQDTKAKSIKLAKMLKKGSNTIIFVKKGCVFCEALLTNMGGKKFKSNILVVTDQHHASLGEFQAKANDHKDIKGTWLYDLDNKFSSELKFQSFPTILVLDKNQKVLAHQVGLVMVKDPTKLQGLPFPKALALMADNTVNWLNNH